MLQKRNIWLYMQYMQVDVLYMCIYILKERKKKDDQREDRKTRNYT